MKRILVIAVLLAPVTGWTTESGQALFESLENTLLEARNVRLGAVVTATGTVDAELSGEVDVVQQLDRLSFGFRGKFNGERWTAELFSNGDRLRWRTEDRFFDVPAPSELEESILLGLTRMGVLHNIAVIGAGNPPDHADGGMVEWAQVTNFTDVSETEADGRKLKHFGFDLVVSGTPSGSATLWLDAETGLPVRREQTTVFPDGEMQVVEIYREVVINASVVTESKAFRTEY